jgi:hypothetical protein
MLAPADDRGITIETRTWLPSDGQQVFYYPHPDRGHGKADVVCRIDLPSGRTWYAAAPSKLLVPTAFVMPDGASVFVEGFIVRANDPHCWDTVPLSSIEEYAWDPARRIVVFNDWRALAAYDCNGLRWLKRLDHLDVLRIVSIDNERIHIKGRLDADSVGKCPTALRVTDGDELFDQSA